MLKDSEEDIIELEDHEDESDREEENGHDDGDFDNDPDGLTEWFRERKKTLVAGGGAILAVIILAIIFFPAREGSVSKDDFRALLVRVDRIESRLAQLDGLEAAILDLLEAQVSVPEEGALADRLDILAGKVEALQQRIGYVVSDIQAVRKASSGDAPLYHTVQRGETLFGIARMHNISLDRLCAINKIGPKDTLNVGQRLLINPGTKE
ncbi:MAG: LysM domain-containing protein [Syntrophales bacterium]|nr:LysM domain-containing protein [Syntrophales bacterium]